MNAANQELCEELYLLSGWDDNAAIQGMQWYTGHRDDSDYQICPRYDLGYLLRMLPGRIGSRGQYAYLRMSKVGKSYAFAYMSPELIWTHENKADTPEDAACRLAIKLFKAGVLTKEATR